MIYFAILGKQKIARISNLSQKYRKLVKFFYFFPKPTVSSVGLLK